MQRRTAGGGGPTPPGQTYSFSTTTSAAISPAGGLGRSVSAFGRNKNHPIGSSESKTDLCLKILCSPTFLLGVAVLLSVVAWLAPSDVYSMRKQTTKADEVFDWINHQVHNYGSDAKPKTRLELQESKWVDGEKKLKAELKKLVELQKQGMEIGVPVLSRWLGDDIPAWAGTGVDVDEWNSKVKAAYAKMREEEEEWKQTILSQLENK